MNRKLAIIIGLQAFLIVMLFWLLVFYGKDEFEEMSELSEEEIETISRITDKDGAIMISLSPAAQKQSDIQTSPLKASTHQASISTYGNVVSIDSLIELRNRYLAIKSEVDVLKASLNHDTRELERLKTLNLDNKNVSDKAVATTATNVRTNETKIAAAESNAKNIVDSIRQLWGDTLAQHAINPKTSDLLQALISNKKVLIQTTLPFDAAEPKPNSTIMIAPTAAPSHTTSAQYVSPAPITNTTIQGKTYFYHAVTNELRAGMQINATTATSNQRSNGVIVPNNAIIWYAGKPWVYQKTGADQFSRKPIHTDVEVENGWFYQGDLKANDEVVISGAQLLLSEEFKSQIMNENDD
ncbi:MAG: hypothetical protein CTY38_05970 [Methylotenera sp.]|uniref:hypothetical protein n=1 Tax=Methylotenera sp. TaxID=2051956 RepID=UPI000D4D6B56|nr:hypothetical protein [Methylotenera sp.]PPC82685.1 MAG: hypothetical protein CTY38_05970 [Methylotenera sp.]